jgi:hypothetical protein
VPEAKTMDGLARIPQLCRFSGLPLVRVEKGVSEASKPPEIFSRDQPHNCMSSGLITTFAIWIGNSAGLSNAIDADK